jgi:hypothetical protein
MDLWAESKIRHLAKVFLCHGCARILTDFEKKSVKSVARKIGGDLTARLMQEVY